MVEDTTPEITDINVMKEIKEVVAITENHETIMVNNTTCQVASIQKKLQIYQ